MATRQTGRYEPLLDESLFPFRMRMTGARSFAIPQQTARAPRPIRGLLLDAYDLLYDDTGWRRWLLRLLLRLGLRTEFGPFFRIFDRDYLDAVWRGKQPFQEAMDAFLISAGLTPGQADEIHRALDSHRHQSDAHHRPLASVGQTLAHLTASGVTLGVLCNCEYSGAEIRQRSMDLFDKETWATVISSRDLGSTMPDTACYRAALDVLQLPLAEVAFVGHDARELCGAAAQGLATIALNCDRDARADVYLQRFEDLIEVTRFSPGCSAAA